MKKKPLSTAIQETRIDSFSHDGRGIARINGKTTFIAGALPGELVQFTYSRVKKDFDEGIVTTILEPALMRVSPPCPHVDHCGGCTLQHLSSAAQIELKSAQLLAVLKRIAHCEPKKIAPPLLGSTTHYRYKARLSVRYIETQSQVLLGFREREHANFITDVTDCLVLHTAVSRRLGDLRAMLNAFEVKSTVTHIEVACGDDTNALIFKLSRLLTPADEARLKAFAIETGFHVYLQLTDLDSVSLFYPLNHDPLLYMIGPEEIRYAFHPTDFIQINPEMNHKMIRQALDWLSLSSEDVVLDLFCGLGNFTLPIAKHVLKVVGVEGSARMVERARRNATQNEIASANFLTANLDDVAVLKTLRKVYANKMLLDPPRAGAYAIVKQIETLKIKRILYISCDPATFARDAAVLVHEKGYILRQIGVMDMFPHTAHVELMAVFTKG